MIEKSELLRFSRNPNSHKGQNGKVLIVGGSVQYVGAPALAALAALKAGVDIVNIAAPEIVALTINSYSPDLITTKLKGDFLTSRHFSQIAIMAMDYDVVLIGNGLKNTDVSKLVYKIEVPVVLDAGAFYKLNLKKIDDCLLTPHAAEFERLLKNSRIDRSQLQKYIGDNVILLKGKLDKIISKSRISYNNTGNAGMTVGGTGDVLAGLTAAMLAQSGNMFRSACTAAYVNGKAGNLCYSKYGYGFTASDMINEIPTVMKTLERKSL